MRSWDLAFLRLRYDYFGQIIGPDWLRLGPHGKDLEVVARLRRRGGELRDQAPDEVRRGWARMYEGLIAENLAGARGEAAAHYAAALRAGEAGDDLLAREAQRHLGDHDHDNGDHSAALDRWSRATALGAGAGTVAGTLSQQMLLAVLARDTGDHAGADLLARDQPVGDGPRRDPARRPGGRLPRRSGSHRRTRRRAGRRLAPRGRRRRGIGRYGRSGGGRAVAYGFAEGDRCDGAPGTGRVGVRSDGRALGGRRADDARRRAGGAGRRAGLQHRADDPDPAAG